MADPVRREHVRVIGNGMRVALDLGTIRTAREASHFHDGETYEGGVAMISRIEHAEDLFLSTLRGYVEALGGELRLTAVFPDQEIVIEPVAKLLDEDGLDLTESQIQSGSAAGQSD